MGKKPLTIAQQASRERLKQEAGERLRLVRRVLDLDQGEFARRAGLAANTYNQIELGTKLPSIETAIMLCEAYRISLDWIFRGEPGDMSVKLWDGIRALRSQHD
jgi:DNA-binding XRE family transcriptional regulator